MTEKKHLLTDLNLENLLVKVVSIQMYVTCLLKPQSTEQYPFLIE